MTSGLAWALAGPVERDGIAVLTLPLRHLLTSLWSALGADGGREGGVVMAWSIAEVASMSKVTARTLRHYDDIGLLKPAHVGGNGYRYYEQEQLLRLQRLLLLRELGLSLTSIAAVLEGQLDEVAALQAHARWLDDERQRLDRLAHTLSRTIHHLQGGPQMSAPDLFEGFTERQSQLEDELAQQHGDGVREHFRTAEDTTKDWTQQDYLDAQRRGEAVDAQILAVMRSGAAPGSEPALAAVTEHYREVAQFWTPDQTSYTNLGQRYVDDPDQKARYDTMAPGLAEYLRDAVAAYAARYLS